MCFIYAKFVIIGKIYAYCVNLCFFYAKCVIIGQIYAYCVNLCFFYATWVMSGHFRAFTLFGRKLVFIAIYPFFRVNVWAQNCGCVIFLTNMMSAWYQICHPVC